MNASKRLRFLAVAAGSACLVSAILFSIAIFGARTASAADPAPSSSQALPLYTVGAYNNRVAVFLYGESEPSQVLDEVFLRSLPAGDQERLREGIPVYEEQELWSLLEDLES